MLALVGLACRTVLVIVFAVALASKVHSRNNFRAFADSLSALGARRLAGIVVAAEAAVVVLLALPTVWGFIVAIGLLAVFIAGIVRVVQGKRKVNCRCFGAGGAELNGSHVVRNALLVAVATVGWIAEDQSTFAWANTRGAICLAAGALIGLVFVRWDDLRFLFD